MPNSCFNVTIYVQECPAGDDFWSGAARTVLEVAKAIERPQELKDNLFNSKVIEEYIIETRDDARLQFIIKLVILQRNSDYEYMGEVQQRRELSTGGFHDISYRYRSLFISATILELFTTFGHFDLDFLWVHTSWLDDTFLNLSTCIPNGVKYLSISLTKFLVNLRKIALPQDYAWRAIN